MSWRRRAATWRQPRGLATKPPCRRACRRQPHCPPWSRGARGARSPKGARGARGRRRRPRSPPSLPPLPRAPRPTRRQPRRQPTPRLPAGRATWRTWRRWRCRAQLAEPTTAARAGSPFLTWQCPTSVNRTQAQGLCVRLGLYPRLSRLSVLKFMRCEVTEPTWRKLAQGARSSCPFPATTAATSSTACGRRWASRLPPRAKRCASLSPLTALRPQPPPAAAAAALATARGRGT